MTSRPVALLLADRGVTLSHSRPHVSSDNPFSEAQFHHGHAAAVRDARAGILAAAYHAHPERFVRQPPAPPAIPASAWINLPQQKEAATQ